MSSYKIVQLVFTLFQLLMIAWELSLVLMEESAQISLEILCAGVTILDIMETTVKSEVSDSKVILVTVVYETVSDTQPLPPVIEDPQPTLMLA